MPKFDSLTIIGTLWKYNKNSSVLMVTGPIADGKCYYVLNMQTGLLHHTIQKWTFDETIEDLVADCEFIGYLKELDIPSFVEEKECLKKT